MNKEKLLFSCKTVELSETKTYLELLNRICFYDHENYNGVKLPSDTALDKAQTLVDMPVKAKCVQNRKGEDTFASHEAYLDDDGDVAFDTVPIGVHTEVYIEDDDVEFNGEILHLPCLFAKQRIWTEKKNVVAATKRLFDEGRLYNSWEILSEKYEYANGVKTLLDYVFTGNVFLGNDIGVEPAYGHSAKVLSLSAQDISGERLIAEAVAKDLAEDNSKESEETDLKMKDKAEKVVEAQVDTTPAADKATATAETTTEPVSTVAETTVDNTTGESTAETTDGADNADTASAEGNTSGEGEPAATTETSALTERDLRRRLNNACYEKLCTGVDGEEPVFWGCDIVMHFPLDKTIWVCTYPAESELDYILFTYSVDTEDNITLSEPTPVKLVVEINRVNEVIAEKDNTIVKMNQEISELKESVTKLEPFREAYEKAELEREKAEKEAHIAELKDYVVNSKVFSSEELQSEKINKLIEDLNKSELQSMIADRLVLSYKEKNKTSKVCTSSTEPAPTIKADIADNGEISYKTIISEFLKK